jgi:hypothetical protein
MISIIFDISDSDFVLQAVLYACQIKIIGGRIYEHLRICLVP